MDFLEFRQFGLLDLDHFFQLRILLHHTLNIFNIFRSGFRFWLLSKGVPGSFELLVELADFFLVEHNNRLFFLPHFLFLNFIVVDFHVKFIGLRLQLSQFIESLFILTRLFFLQLPL